MNHLPTTTPIACTPAAVPAEKRDRWLEIGRRIYGAVEEVRELPDGYACRLPKDEATLIAAAEYVSLDRHCCKFVTWTLRVEPDQGSFWLWVTGPHGTKELTRSTFETTDLIREGVLETAGFRRLGRRDPLAGV